MRTVLCMVGLVAMAVFLILLGLGLGPLSYSDSSSKTAAGGGAGIQTVGAVRRALGEKKLKGDAAHGNGVEAPSEKEVSEMEMREREMYFRDKVICKNDHVVYSRNEALRASTTSQIPKDKFSIMTPLKENDAATTTDSSSSSSSSRIIIVIHEWVLDVTTFLQFHPGGKMLLEGVGKADSAGIFMQHHGPSTATLLEAYCIGVVKG